MHGAHLRHELQAVDSLLSRITSRFTKTFFVVYVRTIARDPATFPLQPLLISVAECMLSRMRFGEQLLDTGAT